MALRAPLAAASTLALLLALDRGVDESPDVTLDVPHGALLSQDVHDTFVACGPTSILNGWLCEGEAGRAAFEALAGDSHGTKISTTIDREGAAASVVYRGHPRWNARTGVANLDLVQWARALREAAGLESVAGLWLDRPRQEPDVGHLERVHGALAASLRAGVAPIVKLRSWAPGPNPGGEGLVWNGLSGHWVTVVRVDRRLPERARGFRFGYVDPATGSEHEAYASIELQRPFNAAKGDEVNWQWAGDRSFLVVTAPDCATLGLGRLDWHRRSNVTLDYAIGQF